MIAQNIKKRGRLPTRENCMALCRAEKEFPCRWDKPRVAVEDYIPRVAVEDYISRFVVEIIITRVVVEVVITRVAVEADILRVYVEATILRVGVEADISTPKPKTIGQAHIQ